MATLTVSTNLPFKPARTDEGRDCSASIEECSIYRMLPAHAKEYMKRSPHLLEYLHAYPVNTYGIPLFFSDLRRDLKDLKEPNLIYPANEDTFIHIFPDPVDARNWYIPIEPSFLRSVNELIPAVEAKLVNLLDALENDPKTDAERVTVLKELISRVVHVAKPGETPQGVVDHALSQQGMKEKMMAFLNKDLTAGDGDDGRNPVLARVPRLPDGRIVMTPSEYRAVEYLVVRDKVDLGVLKPYLNDRWIEDVTCDGLGPIFIEHKIFRGLKSIIEFHKSEELDQFVVKLGERLKKPLTYRTPIIDATLPDGSRINIVYGTEISKRGSNFTIRKAMAEDVISVLRLVEFGTCNYLMAGYFWICIEHGMSMFMSGETASGKTTSLNAVTAFIPPEHKIVSIEDTPELQVPHKNWTREVSKAKGKGEGEGADVTMFDLLKSALRQRPNIIIVGEIRGVEGSVAFGAMQTGHPVLSTFHAASVEKLIQRLCGDPINIPKTFLDNLNIVVIQSAVKRPSGETVRRMLSVNELVGYNPDTGGISFVEIFKWNPVNDTFEFTGKGASFLLENKIATMLGFSDSRKPEIYDEVEKRARILERLHKAGYTDYRDLFQMIVKVKKEGLIRIGGTGGG
ncbi:MAG: type II/IV secretion system ATPase subunit [Methanomicrobiales archaeon]|nr:type II/IV secretion system ATPase subunit [Methanomicrobiales archaeon]